METNGKIRLATQVCAVVFSKRIKSMEPIAKGVHQPTSAFVANTTQFQAIAQVKCAVIAKKSGADALGVTLAREMTCASEMHGTKSLRIGVGHVLLRGLVRNVESVLLRHPECQRTQHVLIVCMMLRRF